MSSNVNVEGYVIVKIPIHGDFGCSNSATPEKIVQIVLENLQYKIGSCEIIDHGLQIGKVY